MRITAKIEVISNFRETYHHIGKSKFPRTEKSSGQAAFVHGFSVPVLLFGRWEVSNLSGVYGMNVPPVIG